MSAHFIGIDPGLVVTAIATESGNSVKFQATTKGIQRLLDIRGQLAGWIAQEFTPSIVVSFPSQIGLAAIEGYSFASRNQAHQVGELGGVLRVWLVENGIPYIDVPPTSLKKFVCGKGNAKKDEMRLGVFKRWQKEFDTEHEIDAYALAKLAEAMTSPLVGLTKPQQEVVKKLQSQITASKTNSTTQEIAHGGSRKRAGTPVTAGT